MQRELQKLSTSNPKCPIYNFLKKLKYEEIQDNLSLNMSLE